MIIHKIEIENFRSIRKLTLYPRDLCALVGPNNAGKTNILAAVNFLLGERYPSRNSIEPSDFLDPSEPLHICATFEENDSEIEHLWCTLPLNGRGDVRFSCFRDDRERYLTDQVREQCALVYLDANRSLEYHLGHSRWTLFGRIIRQLDQDFRDNVPAERQQDLVNSFDHAKALLQTDLYRAFETNVRDAFAEQLRETDHDIQLDFRTFDPINYYRSIHPLLQEGGRTSNPTHAGQGMRNLLLLALFRAYARVFRGDAIIAIEEPEIYMHPHAQRSLAGLFDELATNGNQVLYTTHSGNFIDMSVFKI